VSSDELCLPGDAGHGGDDGWEYDTTWTPPPPPPAPPDEYDDPPAALTAAMAAPDDEGITMNSVWGWLDDDARDW